MKNCSCMTSMWSRLIINVIHTLAARTHTVRGAQNLIIHISARVPRRPFRRARSPPPRHLAPSRCQLSITALLTHLAFPIDASVQDTRVERPRCTQYNNLSISSGGSSNCISFKVSEEISLLVNKQSNFKFY